MKVYLAGNTFISYRERSVITLSLKILKIVQRLISFHYDRQTELTLKEVYEDIYSGRRNI